MLEVEAELAPALTFSFARLSKELQVGSVYLNLFNEDPKVVEIEHPDKFAKVERVNICKLKMY